jgi:hypothetical protein
MYSRFVFLLVSLFIAIAPAFAYDWDHEAGTAFGGKLVERRSSIQGMSINCLNREACKGNFASGTMRDFFVPLESQLLASDSNATLFSYDELFLLYAVSAQFYRDKSAAWDSLVRLMENADAVRDSLSRRNNPFAKDSTFAETFAQLLNYQDVEDGFSELDVSRELKEAFRVVLEAVVVGYSRSRLVEMEKNSHDGSKYGVSYQFLEKARDRFFSRYPQSRYTGLILGYIPEAYAQESLARMMSEKKWFMFSMGLGGAFPSFDGELAETVDVPFAIPVVGEFQVWRVIFGFDFASGLGQKKTLWKGTDKEMVGSGFGFLMGQLDMYIGFSAIETKHVTLDLLAGLAVADYEMVNDGDYMIQGMGGQLGAQVDFKIPLSTFVDLFVRSRYTVAFESAELYIPDALRERRPEVNGFPSFGPVDGIRHSFALIVGFCAGTSKPMLEESFR